MRRSISAAFFSICLVVTFVPSTAASANSSPIEITPITGVFHPSLFETTYHTLITFNEPLLGEATDDVRVEWTLKLELVDKAGAPDPTTLGSGAAVDIGCTNHGVEEKTEVVTFRHKEYLRTSFFEWHHPDAANSDPVGWYHCNHELQGPHGHQGLITLVISDAKWRCVATFKGTHSSILNTNPHVPNPNVKNGTASEPTCRRI
jgi:hypothetical protein